MWKSHEKKLIKCLCFMATKFKRLFYRTREGTQLQLKIKFTILVSMCVLCPLIYAWTRFYDFLFCLIARVAFLHI